MVAHLSRSLFRLWLHRGRTAPPRPDQRRGNGPARGPPPARGRGAPAAREALTVLGVVDGTTRTTWERPFPYVNRPRQRVPPAHSGAGFTQGPMIRVGYCWKTLGSVRRRKRFVTNSLGRP